MFRRTFLLFLVFLSAGADAAGQQTGWWVLEFETSAASPMGSGTTTGKVEFYIDETSPIARGEGSTTMKGSFGESMEAKLVLDGFVEDGNLVFTMRWIGVRMTGGGATFDYGEGLDLGSQEDPDAIALRDGEEKIHNWKDTVSNTSGKTVWRLRKKPGAAPPPKTSAASNQPSTYEPERWQLKIKFSNSFMVSSTADGTAELTVDATGKITGTGNLSAVQTSSLPHMTPAKGQGAFEVTGRREGEHLTFSFKMRSILIQGWIQLPNSESSPYELEFDPSFLAQEHVIERKSGATSTVNHDFADGGSSVTEFTLSKLAYMPPPPGKVPASDKVPVKGEGTCEGKQTRENVLAVLTKWRSKILPSVPPVERLRVESYVKECPLQTPPGVEPILVNAIDGQTTPRPKRRDWAYAVQGTSYTFLGLLSQDQKWIIDVGFWCFLEASLLQTSEAEHLANVSFHLNTRGEYNDAIIVLCYARSLNTGHPAVSNNLATAMAAFGNHEGAAEQMKRAATARPSLPIYRERQAGYAAQTGLSPAPKATALAEPIEVLAKIEKLIEETTAKLDKISESYYTQGLVLYDQHVARAVQIAERAEECMLQVWISFPEDYPYQVCVNCTMPATEQMRGNFDNTIGQIRPLIAEWEADAFPVLNAYTEKGLDLVVNSGLEPAQQHVLFVKIREDIYQANYQGIITARKVLHRITEEADYEWLMVKAEGCRKIGVEAPPVDLQLVQVDSAWCVGIGFPGLSVQISYDGTIKLSAGQGLLLKVQYNYRTDKVAVGFGVGVNLGMVAKAEAFVMFSEDKGITPGLKVGVQTPKFLPVPHGGTFDLVKLADMPKPSLQYMAFENL